MGRKSKIEAEKLPKKTFTISLEALAILDQQKNKSGFISKAILFYAKKQVA